MDNGTQPPGRAKLQRMIHAAMFTGVALVTGVLVYRRSLPDAPPIAMPRNVGLGLVSVAILLIGVGSALFRPRIPARASDQTPDDYWGNPAVASRAMLLWAVCEAAALLGVLAYFLAGMTSALAVAALGVLVGIIHRPSALERN